MTTIVASVLIFGLMVLSHEFGHFIAAKKAGVSVEEFSIGMGPKIAGWEGKETHYAVRLFPVGGFVKMLGEEEDAEGEGSFLRQPLKNRMGIILAGPAMNFMLAMIIFSMIVFIVGTPTTSIGTIQAGRPADLAGLQAGDRIVEIDGKRIDSWNSLHQAISTSKAEEIRITVERKGEAVTFPVKPVNDAKTGQRIIGIAPLYKKSIPKAVATGIRHSFNTLVLMVTYLTDLVRGKASTADIVGAIGMIHLVGQAAKTGVLDLMSLAGLLSLNLAVINLLPIPALDGGKFMFLLLEGIRGKPIDIEKESLIHFLGFVFLILLMLAVTYKDIVRFNLF